MADLRNVVVITGASSGIGRATATAMAAAGHHVVLVARAREPLEAAATECTTAGAASVLVVPTDVGCDEQVEQLVATVMAEHARIDVVVHAAGVVAYGRTEEVPAAVFDGVLRTNLVGSVNIARHVVPVLRRQGGGTLLLVGSVIGHVAIPTMTAYVLSKWGVRALARQLRIENRDLAGVRILYAAPGSVDTPIYRQAANYARHAGRPLLPRRRRTGWPDSCCAAWTVSRCPNSSASSITPSCSATNGCRASTTPWSAWSSRWERPT